MNNIESIINPKSIAVVGATNRPGSVGSASFKNLLQAGYKGVLYPVICDQKNDLICSSKGGGRWRQIQKK